MVKSLSAVLEQNVTPRVLGFDDAPFSVRPRVPLSSVPFVGVLTSGAHFEDMLYGTGIEQDGLNATDVLRDAILGSKFHAQIHAVVLDGVTAGGLNVVGLPVLADAVQRPVVAVMRRPPDLPAVEAAAAALPEGTERVRRIRAAGRVHEIGRWVFQVCAPAGVGIEAEAVARILDKGTPNEAQKVPE